MSEPLTDTARMRLIVKAYLECKQTPWVADVSKQFRHETGRDPEPHILNVPGVVTPTVEP